MRNNSDQINQITPIASLERFPLSFEYDKTLKEVKQLVRTRTMLN